MCDNFYRYRDWLIASQKTNISVVDSYICDGFFSRKAVENGSLTKQVDFDTNLVSNSCLHELNK